MNQTRGRWGGKHVLSFQEYHSNPAEWDIPGLVDAHRSLGGTYDLVAGIPVEERVTGSVRFRQLWYALSGGVRANDPACVELAVRFIEAHLIVSYAGFARQRLARALRHAVLTEDQRRRLSAHFLQLLEREDRCHEFRDYLRLWSDIASDSVRRRALELVSRYPDDGFARLVVEVLTRRPGTADRLGGKPP